MQIAEWLSYTGIDQLRIIHQHYGWEVKNHHSKHELISTLLQQLTRLDDTQRQMEGLTDEEHRFIELVVLDTGSSFTKEELIAKGRAALLGKEGNPRSFILNMTKKGWLFPGYQTHTYGFFYVPSDMKKQLIQALMNPYIGYQSIKPPACFRDEEQLMVQDLIQFLLFVTQNMVQLNTDRGMNRQQFRQMMKQFHIPEKPLLKKGYRFGFGRSYHLYPDRLALLYDYAFYKGYIEEMGEYLCLAEKKSGKLIDQDAEGMQIYRFWIRLYKKPIPHLPILVRWVGLLGARNWFPVDTLYSVVKRWLTPYYYHSEFSLFQLVMKMLAHLGVIRLGEEENKQWIYLTPTGDQWMRGISAFHEKAMEKEFFYGRR